jgi:predicted acyltransferase
VLALLVLSRPERLILMNSATSLPIEQPPLPTKVSTTPRPSGVPAASSAPPQRLVSLDALRGADMFLLVGLAGIFRALPAVSDHAAFQFLSDQCQHPEWHGFTLYDLIFPLFIFIVGAAIPFSIGKRLEHAGARWPLYRHIVARTIVLTLLGLVYWGTPGGAHPTWGYYSVLYRIGISYFFAALIAMHARPRGQAIAAFALVIGYWLAYLYIPVPGYGAGNFTQEGCLQNYLADRLAEAWSPNFRHVFSITLIPSIATALFGVLAGHWLRSPQLPGRKAAGLLLAGALFVAAGLLAHDSMPINKKMWSASFTWLTVGLSLLLLAVSYWLVDVRGWRKSAFFFVVVGMNPIVIYLGTRLVDFKKIAGVFVGGFVDSFGAATPLVMAIATATAIWLFLYYLYVNKVFLRI